MKPDLEQKILRYLYNHPDGLSDALLRAWLDSCRKGGGYTTEEANDALRALRDKGTIACTNGSWWLRTIKRRYG